MMKVSMRSAPRRIRTRRREPREEWWREGSFHASALPRNAAQQTSEAGLLTRRSSQHRLPSHPAEQWLASPAARCSQWRDRAGFSPASLFTRRSGKHPGKGNYMDSTEGAEGSNGLSEVNANSSDFDNRERDPSGQVRDLTLWRALLDRHYHAGCPGVSYSGAAAAATTCLARAVEL